MNREFEILNEKLNIIFNELGELRRDFYREKNEKEVKKLEYEAKRAQEEVENRKECVRYECERLDEIAKCFRGIEYRFPRNDMTCERVEK